MADRRGPAQTRIEWAMGSIISDLIYPQADEEQARALAAFYRVHYPERQVCVARRTVTIGPWETVDEEAGDG